MIRSRLFCYFTMLLLCVSAVSCRKYSGFKHGKGFYYQYHIQNPNNPKPQTGDFVEVNMSLRAGDEVISPMTRNNMLMDELYKGDIFCALRTMHLDDSATFIFDGPKFYEEFLGMGDYPYGKDPIYADVKLLKILSKQSMDKAEEVYREQRQQMRIKEDSIVKAYANENNFDNVHKGIYYTCTRKGNGAKARRGKIVSILYKGRRLDNEVFHQSVDPEHPLKFEVGKDQVARGIDVIVQEMNEGDQITAIFPSSLAFGDKGNEEFKIPPFTPVVYEIELLKVERK